MARTTVVFLGPSLPAAEAARLLPALYRPPAEQGDVVRAVRDLGAGAIALIDGAFASAPAVRHKEILWALSRGVAVYGAASLGALRAAELHGYGMRGVGLIYRWYRAMPLADDGEVAVAMTPREVGAEPLSEALVNMRATFRAAVRAGLIADAARARLVATARAIPFMERTYPALFAQARDEGAGGWIDRFEAWVESNAVDQKRRDAAALLRMLARPACDERSDPRPPFRMTEAWAEDLAASGLDSLDI